MTLDDVLQRYRTEPEPAEDRVSGPFKLRSAVEGPAHASEVSDAWPSDTDPLAAELWASTRSASLFEDIDFRQWGLVLLDPARSADRTVSERLSRPTDVREDDVVIGEFLGDQELLVLAPSESGARRVLVALPLDHRSDWFGVGNSLAEFLGAYFDNAGEKFWER